MHEEQDTCRICSAPAEPDQPLFHPCKCSGTIRYIHQDCLTTWLNHSKKKTCDVCKHPYAFTKVYSKDMPMRLPAFLVIRQFAQQSVTTLLFVFRGVMVGVVWLAVLPWITVWTWRMYFTMGDSTAWWISDRPRPIPQTGFGYFPFYHNATDSQDSRNATVNSTLYGQITSHPVWMAVSADIFTGQIIASLIVLTFVAIFLLREWIVQNARPGVFEEIEIPPLPEGAEAVLPPEENVDAPAPVVDQEPQEDITDTDSEEERPLHDSESSDETTTGSDSPTHDREPLRRSTFGEAEAEEEPSLEEMRRRMRKAAMKRRRIERGESSGSSSSGSPPPPERRPRFHTRYEQRSSSEPRTIGSSPSYLDDVNDDVRRSRDSQAPSGPSSSIPRSPAGFPRRPPLPTSERSSKVNTPLASPHLATYRAPEDLAAGPSGVSGYFDDEARPGSDTEAEHRVYFREPEDGEGRMSDSEGGSEEGDEFDEVEEFSDSLPSLDSLESDSADEGFGFDDDIADDEEELLLDEAEERFRELEGDVRDDDLPGEQDDPPPLDGNEEFDAVVDEENDMEGALEVIGLRGPILGVFQNAALVIFVLDTVIGLGVWVPYTIGKTTALLTLDPPRLLRVLHFPIRIIQIFTDPILDSLLFVASHILLPVLVNTILLIARAFRRVVHTTVGSVFGQDAALNTAEAMTAFHDRSRNFLELQWNTTVNLLQPNNDQTSVPITGEASSLINQMFDSDVRLVRWAEPHFAAFGGQVRVTSTAAAATWIRMALGNGSTEKVFAIILGYAVVALLLAIYLNVLTTGSVRSAGRAIRSTVRQQLLIAKVGAFIIFELVIFPFGCGVMLDLSSIWLFTNSSYHSRWVFFQSRPITAVFYHWVAGTMFMYHFAILLSGCRDILRPGAMWFIKDPQDQNFHPIRDILERPTLTHLRKLVVSAQMYSIVIMAGVGSVGGFLWLCPTVLPFRWKPRDNLSDVPVDLLILQLVLPYTMQYFRPFKPIKNGAAMVWGFLSSQLRLTSYMFGERVPDEEYTPAYSIWTLFKPSQMRSQDTKDGGFCRVPATDQIALTRDMGGIAAVEEDGTPVTEAAKKLIEDQNAEAEKAGRKIEDDYIIVYLPPMVRIRMFLFMFGLWAIGSLFITSAIASPILLGRQVFKLFVAHDVHDGYSFLLGFYLLYGCCIVGRALDRMDKRRQRSFSDDEDSPMASRSLYVVKRSLLWLAQITYMILFCGIILPTLLSLVVEVYLILPIRFSMNHNFVPRIRIVDMWALGLLYTRIALRTHHIHSRTGVARGLEKISRNGWTHPDPWSATLEVFFPVTGGLAGMLLLPAFVVWAFRALLGMQIDNRFLLMHVFPGIFAAAGFFRMAGSLGGVFVSWSQSVRDKEFLVEMQLRNLEPEDKKLIEVKREAQTPSVDGTDVGDF